MRGDSSKASVLGCWAPEVMGLEGPVTGMNPLTASGSYRVQLWAPCG